MTDLAQAFVARFTAWANTKDDIRAAILTGSQVRTDHPADEWSDVDLLVFTTDVPAMLDSGTWTAEIGPTVLTFLEATVATGITERRALYETGLEVDYVILPTAMLDLVTGDAAGQGSAELRTLVASIFSRGFRVAIDKDRRLTRLGDMTFATQPQSRPDAARFAKVIDDFWFHALWTARKLHRGELLMAKNCCDGGMKANLLAVARWHVAAGPGSDTWHQTRFFEQWADPRLVADLGGCYAHYDESDIARALRATMRTFDWLARETAAHFDYAYPDAAVRWIADRVAETIGAADAGIPSAAE